MNNFNDINVVAVTSCVGLSIATLLSQHHYVTVVNVISEKIEKENNYNACLKVKVSNIAMQGCYFILRYTIRNL